MLLGPQLEQGFRDPAVDGPEAVQPRVAGGAEGDQGGGTVRGAAVVDDERGGRSADAAEPAVAGEDLFAAAGEAGAVTAAVVVAGFAQPAAVEIGFSAGAAQRELSVRIGGTGGVYSTYDKKHYHR